MHELPHKLPNDLRRRILGNKKILEKCLNLIEWWPSAQSHCQNKSLFVMAKTFVKIATKFLPWCAISHEH